MTDTEKAKPISLRLDQDTLDAIDAAVADGGDRTGFIRDAISEKLGGGNINALTGQAGTGWDPRTAPAVAKGLGPEYLAALDPHSGTGSQ